MNSKTKQKILAYVSEGMGPRKISEQPDIPVSHATVSRFLREHRQERAETTKEIVREYLAATLPTDLEMLDHLTARLEVIRKDAENESDTKTELQTIDRQVKTIGLKLKYSGAGEDDSAQRLIEALSAD